MIKRTAVILDLRSYHQRTSRLVRRRRAFFDRLVVAIAANPNKAPMFSPRAAVDMAAPRARGRPQRGSEGLRGADGGFRAAEAAWRWWCAVCARVSDFEFEFQLAK